MPKNNHLSSTKVFHIINGEFSDLKWNILSYELDLSTADIYCEEVFLSCAGPGQFTIALGAGSDIALKSYEMVCS